MGNIKVREYIDHIKNKERKIRMKEEITKNKENSIKEIKESKDLKQLNEVRVKYVGKKGEYNKWLILLLSVVLN